VRGVISTTGLSVLAVATRLGSRRWHFTDGLTSVVSFFNIFVALLKHLPNHRPPLRHVLPAAAITMILLEMGK
jgi:uncharacterized BrkB/YihY/UPF0761 family membrane protein